MVTRCGLIFRLQNVHTRQHRVYTWVHQISVVLEGIAEVLLPIEAFGEVDIAVRQEEIITDTITIMMTDMRDILPIVAAAVADIIGVVHPRATTTIGVAGGRVHTTVTGSIIESFRSLFLNKRLYSSLTQ